jgi:hydroxymethylpyrimidine/phosphomethylpyrimidine kinase
MSVPIVMTIAGSDSGGSAGIQADLKTFSFLQVHGTSALTCVTAQNTQGVTAVVALAPEAIVQQIQTVRDDMFVSAAKTGMLLNQGIIEAVAKALEEDPIAQLVVDPVMVSRTGAVLLEPGAIQALRKHIIPKALMLTPNRYEAELLSGLTIQSLEDMKQAAQKIFSLGSGTHGVLVKGGGLSNLRGTDVWFDGTQAPLVLTSPTIETRHTHGTGCTLSAAITAYLARGASPFEATRQAKVYLTKALEHSLAIGKGQGPVGHFWALLER